jgi:hypothetical protein
MLACATGRQQTGRAPQLVDLGAQRGGRRSRRALRGGQRRGRLRGRRRQCGALGVQPARARADARAQLARGLRVRRRLGLRRRCGRIGRRAGRGRGRLAVLAQRRKRGGGLLLRKPLRVSAGPGSALASLPAQDPPHGSAHA